MYKRGSKRAVSAFLFKYIQNLRSLWISWINTTRLNSSESKIIKILLIVLAGSYLTNLCSCLIINSGHHIIQHKKYLYFSRWSDKGSAQWFGWVKLSAFNYIKYLLCSLKTKQFQLWKFFINIYKKINNL